MGTFGKDWGIAAMYTCSGLPDQEKSLPLLQPTGPGLRTESDLEIGKRAVTFHPGGQRQPGAHARSI